MSTKFQAEFHEKQINDLCERWQAAANADYARRFGNSTSLRDATRFTIGQKMFHLIIGSSSAFLVNIDTGVIYGNKSWAKPDYGKIVGNAYDPNFNAEVLVRDRFRYGKFENASDGSLRQPIIKR